jgi:hypothetical protein
MEKTATTRFSTLTSFVSSISGSPEDWDMPLFGIG